MIVARYTPTPRHIALRAAIATISNLEERRAQDIIVGRWEEFTPQLLNPVCNVREIATTHKILYICGIPARHEQVVRDYIAKQPGDFYANVAKFSWWDYERDFPELCNAPEELERRARGEHANP